MQRGKVSKRQRGRHIRAEISTNINSRPESLQEFHFKHHNESNQ
jgi:hypothetical protein